jgi:hypothetical protein
MLHNCFKCFERLNLMAPRNYRDTFEQPLGEQRRKLAASLNVFRNVMPQEPRAWVIHQAT